MFQNTKQIILKVTRGCNLACKYCYVFDKPSYNNEEMSDEVFDWTIRRWLSETHRQGGVSDGSENSQPLELILHGGEPLTIGKQKFSRFCKKAFQYAKEFDKVMRIGVQTNSTLLDEDWYEIFMNYNISPGISFDGINQKNDLRENTSDTVFHKLIEMKRYCLNPGPLMVLHRGNFQNLNDTFKMLESIGINSIKVNRGVDNQNAKPEKNGYELNASELLESAKTISNYMFASKGKFREGTLFGAMEKFMGGMKDEMFHEIHTSEFDHCYSKYCGGMKNLMEVEPDGTFQFCGRTSKRSEATVGGSVFDKDVLELNLAQQQWEFQRGRLKSIDKNRCSECSAQWICDGGCLAFSHQKYGEARVDSLTCSYFKKLNKYFMENVREIKTLLVDSGSLQE